MDPGCLHVQLNRHISHQLHQVLTLEGSIPPFCQLGLPALFDLGQMRVDPLNVLILLQEARRGLGPDTGNAGDVIR